MNDAKLKALITEAASLDREIRDNTNRLKALKAILVAVADSNPDEQTPIDGGGSSWQMAGNDGCCASVSFPSPSLKNKIDGVGKTIEKVMLTSGKFFADLFEQVPSWRPKADFRETAAKLMGKDARKLIKLCESETAPRVSFETKRSEVVEV